MKKMKKNLKEEMKVSFYLPEPYLPTPEWKEAWDSEKPISLQEDKKDITEVDPEIRTGS